METLILGGIAIVASVGWGIDTIRSLNLLEKLNQKNQATNAAIRDLTADNDKLRKEASNSKFRNSILIAELQAKINDLKAENSKLTQDLVEAQNKLKTAHNNLRIMMVEYNRWKKGEK